MKRISFIYIVLLPYLIILAMLCFLKHITKITLILFILAVIVICGFAVVSCIAFNFESVMQDNSRKYHIKNLTVKLCNIPIHALLVLFTGGMLNPFLILASWIPLFVSLVLMSFSGLCNVGNCINIYRNKHCGLFGAVLLGIMGFVYGFDIIGAVIQVCKSGKKMKW